MSNLVAALKAEIARLARKEAKSLNQRTADLARANRQELRDIKRSLQEIERVVRRLDTRTSTASEAPAASAARPEGVPEGFRYSVRSLKSQRRRLKLSAADYATLLGVSMQTVYNWEQDKARPRNSQMARIVELRNMGRRQALAELEALGGGSASESSEAAPKKKRAKKASANKKSSRKPAAKKVARKTSKKSTRKKTTKKKTTKTRR